MTGESLLKEDSMERIIDQAPRGKCLLSKQDLLLFAPSLVAHIRPLCLCFCTNQPRLMTFVSSVAHAVVTVLKL